MRLGSAALSIDLPFPPSANSIWRVKRGGGVYPSKEYANWQAQCGWVLKACQLPMLRGRFFATITLGTQRRHGNADADNRIKPTLDVLQKFGVIENDKFAERVTVQWGEAPEGCRVLLEPVTPIMKTEAA